MSFQHHSYILKSDPPPEREDCQCVLTFRHILGECNHSAKLRTIFGIEVMVTSF